MCVCFVVRRSHRSSADDHTLHQTSRELCAVAMSMVHNPAYNNFSATLPLLTEDSMVSAIADVESTAMHVPQAPYFPDGSTRPQHRHPGSVPCYDDMGARYPQAEASFQGGVMPAMSHTLPTAEDIASNCAATPYPRHTGSNSFSTLPSRPLMPLMYVVGAPEPACTPTVLTDTEPYVCQEMHSEFVHVHEAATNGPGVHAHPQPAFGAHAMPTETATTSRAGTRQVSAPSDRGVCFDQFETAGGLLMPATRTGDDALQRQKWRWQESPQSKQGVATSSSAEPTPTWKYAAGITAPETSNDIWCHPTTEAQLPWNNAGGLQNTVDFLAARAMVPKEGMPASQHSPSDGSTGSPTRSDVTSEGYGSGDHSSDGYAHPTGARRPGKNATTLPGTMLLARRALAHREGMPAPQRSPSNYITGQRSPAFSEGTSEGTRSEGYASSLQPCPARTSGNTNDSRSSTVGHISVRSHRITRAPNASPTSICHTKPPINVDTKPPGAVSNPKGRRGRDILNPGLLSRIWCPLHSQKTARCRSKTFTPGSLPTATRTRTTPLPPCGRLGFVIASRQSRRVIDLQL